MTSKLLLLSLAVVCTSLGAVSDYSQENVPHKSLSIMEQPTHNMYLKNIKLPSKQNERRRHRIYTPRKEIETNFALHKDYVNRRMKRDKEAKYFLPKTVNNVIRVKRQDLDECDTFAFNKKEQRDIRHPRGKNENAEQYARNIDCVTIINATEGSVIHLTFVDLFHIEYHPECAYDYLEIRDGPFGYARQLGKFCGEVFPHQITSTGPYIWLKFHSDDTIEYEGFHINIESEVLSTSHTIPESCYYVLEGPDNHYGIVDSSKIDEKCIQGSSQQALDVLWTIKTPENTKIYLNFTQYSLAKPNECEDNIIQVFGSILEYNEKLASFCGSVANSISTKLDESNKNEQGNIMYIRLYASKAAKTSYFNATYVAYRSLDPNKDEKCTDEEFDCSDNTCIDIRLRCDKDAHCRLKADEDYELCKSETESILKQTHIKVILIIFSLILSGMSFVFLFKCIRKLYQDHKLIKEHIRQSCEDRLDDLVSSRLTLDAKRLQRDSEPRASLERENHANEMYKRQRSFPQQQSTSIDSDYLHETQIDLDDEPWRRDVEDIPDIPETEEVKIEKNTKRRSDISRKEETMRKNSKKPKDEEDVKSRKEIRDVSVGAPDTKESSCQTRESLFQVGASSPDGTDSGSGTGSRGFSTFGYSGGTVVRASPAPPPTSTSEITIELLRSVPSKQDSQSKKFPDRRPMSTETTRSAPDVIIVSKPVR